MASNSAIQKLRVFGVNTIGDNSDDDTESEPGPFLRGDSEDFSGLDLSGSCFGITAKRRRIPIAGQASPDRVMRYFPRASFRNASFASAWLPSADFNHVDLSGADFTNAHLEYANLSNATVQKAKFSGAVSYATNWTGLDLSETNGLEKVIHRSPSVLDSATLRNSKGKIPDEFLLGVGFNRWELAIAKLYDPSISGTQIEEVLYRAFATRFDGPIFLGGAFISYSHMDGGFVDLLHKHLEQSKIAAYLDKVDLTAGPLERQIFNQIRICDVVIVVLSKHSCASDWVTAEIEEAREREKKEDRPILCPIALDDTWKEKVNKSVAWRPIKEKNVLPFPNSKSRSKAFDEAFQKLCKGLNTFYSTPKADIGSTLELP